VIQLSVSVICFLKSREIGRIMCDEKMKEYFPAKSNGFYLSNLTERDFALWGKKQEVTK
jgi:hypothetical protein